MSPVLITVLMGLGTLFSLGGLLVATACVYKSSGSCLSVFLDPD